MTMQETETQETRSKVASHKLIDAGGAAVENEEQAKGYQYVLEADGSTFKWMWDEASEAERIMLAIFGAKTLATNETSQLRNSPKRKTEKDSGYFESAAGIAEQMAAITDRFTDLRSGTWVDRTREPGVPRIDVAKLATAIVDVKVQAGKTKEADRDSAYAETLERLQSDKEYLKGASKQPQVSAAYAALVGKQTMSVDDL